MRNTFFPRRNVCFDNEKLVCCKCHLTRWHFTFKIFKIFNKSLFFPCFYPSQFWGLWDDDVKMSQVILYNVFFCVCVFLKKKISVIFCYHYYIRFIQSYLFIKNFSLSYSTFPKCLGSQLIIIFSFCMLGNSSLERVSIFFKASVMGLRIGKGWKYWLDIGRPFSLAVASCPLGETKPWLKAMALQMERTNRFRIKTLELVHPLSSRVNRRGRNKG